MLRNAASLLGLCVAVTVSGLVSPVAAQAQARDASDWVVPRTADGRPDLQGNWSSATITPLQRPRDQDAVLSWEEVERREETAAGYLERVSQPSDPDRPAPPQGGDGSRGGAGNVGGYNGIYIDRGDKVAVVNGEPRSSLITHPANGRMPPRTEEARQRGRERRQLRGQFEQYDHPELRPLGERCLVSFGSNAGPPMLPNGFYNNNYTIVQTADHIMIMTEMVHDARIIRLGERVPLPEHIRPWMGDSWGHWEGDTLVIETTNLSAKQMNGTLVYPGGSDEMRVIERLTRVDESTINYEFTVTDPGTYTAPWGGQVPMKALNDLIYEYACHEGNYALGNVLSGARYQERMDAENRN